MQSTHRIVHKAIGLVIDVNQMGATVIREQFTNAGDVSKLVDVTPVLDIEVVQVAFLQTNGVEMLQLTDSTKYRRTRLKYAKTDGGRRPALTSVPKMRNSLVRS